MVQRMNETVECNFCKENIQLGARICKHCSRDQNLSRAKIDRYGKLIGYCVGVLTLLSFFVSSAPQVREVLFPKTGIEVVSLSLPSYWSKGRTSPETAVIYNKSKSRVFVTQALFEGHMEDGEFSEGSSEDKYFFTGYLNVHQQIEPESYLNHNLSPDFLDGKPTGYALTRLYARDEKEGQISDEEWVKVLDEIENAAFMSPLYEFALFSENSAKYMQMQNFHKGNLRTFPVRATVYYRVGDDTEEQEVTINGVGVVFKYRQPIEIEVE